MTGVRFLRSQVGARIAYTTMGSGPPLIVVAPWMTHCRERTLGEYERC